MTAGGSLVSSNTQMFTWMAPSSARALAVGAQAEQQFVKIKDTQVLNKLRGRLVVTGQKMGTQESGHKFYTSATAI